MRIVHYLTEINLSHGGVVRAALDLCATQAARGQEVCLLTYDPRDAPDAWPRERAGAGGGLPWVRAMEWPRLPAAWLHRASARAAEDAAAWAEVVHVHAMWMPSNAQVGRLCERRGTAYGVSPHGMLTDWSMARSRARKRLHLALLGSRMLRRAGFVHFAAGAERDESLRWLPRRNDAVIPLSFDLSPFRDLPGPGLATERFGLGGGEGPAILFLSRLYEGKGLELLLEACAILRDRGRAFRLLIAGSGEPAFVRGIEAQIDALGLRERARMLGPVYGREKVSLYQACEAVVLPSVHENFGFVAPEAMASGVAPIVSRGFKVWPELERSGGAVVVPELTPTAFADAIAGLLDDPGRRSALGSRARSWVFEWLSEDRVAAEYEAMYRRAGGG